MLADLKKPWILLRICQFNHKLVCLDLFSMDSLILEKWQSAKCYYILMKLVTMYSCNLYASDGRWSQVNQVRELMKQSGLRKSPRHSQVEMDISDDISLPKVALLW